MVKFHLHNVISSFNLLHQKTNKSLQCHGYVLFDKCVKGFGHGFYIIKISSAYAALQGGHNLSYLSSVIIVSNLILCDILLPNNLLIATAFLISPLNVFKRDCLNVLSLPSNVS